MQSYTTYLNIELSYTSSLMSRLSRLQEEHKKALLERQEQLNTWEKFKADYEALSKRLESLPNKVSHEVMVPFGSIAFMPGKLIHTNEILVLLGDNWFVERSATQAQQIVQRRIKYVDQHIKGVKEDLKGFRSRLEYTEELESKEGSGVVDIREEVTPQEDKKLKNRHVRKAHRGSNTSGTKRVYGLKNVVQDPKSEVSRKTGDFSTEDAALFARLDELEALEHKRKELSDGEQSLESEESQQNLKVINKEDILRKQRDQDFEVEEEDSDMNGKHVRWKDGCVDSDDEEEDYACKAIPVTFTPCSAMPLKSTALSPADIYGMLQKKDATGTESNLKSILKTPSVEEKLDTVSTSERPTAPQVSIATKDTLTAFEPHKAFCGQVVEKSVQSQDQKQSITSQVSAPPVKRVSKFKAARQQLKQ